MLNPSTHNDDINRLRFDHAALRFKWELIKRAHYGRKYRPNQLRIPRGKDFAGRFANEGNRRPKPQQAFLPAEAVPLVVEKTIVAGVALNLALSNRGAGEKKPIITFNAKEYRDGKLDVESVAAFGIGQFRVRARDLRALCDGKHKGPQKPQTRQKGDKMARMGKGGLRLYDRDCLSSRGG